MSNQPTAQPTPAPPSAVGTGLDLQTCRRCGRQTQAGFAFCQHCGAMLPTAPANPGLRGSIPPPVTNDMSPEAVAPTLTSGANDAKGLRSQPGSMSPPMPTPLPAGRARTPTPPAGVGRLQAPAGQPGHAGGAPPPYGADRAWGTLYSVRRDGSDGDGYPLTGEWVEIGRQSAHLSFDDRYLATSHARFELVPGGGCRVVPMDPLNGVYRKIRGPHMITDGTHILIGREMLRFDLVSDPERQVSPLVRFGVTMFGSPARAPWGRLSQVLANGGLRDVRHLHGSEVVLGREEGDVVFRDDEFLSRRHAVLRWQNGGCVLDDLRSSNGTFIRLRGPQPLEHGDILRMGDQMFRIEVGEPPPAGVRSGWTGGGG